jgi:hypothetical protein
VVLLDEVVQILGLPQLDGQATVGHQTVDGCGVGAALVYRDLLWHVVPIDGALEESCPSGKPA